MPSIQKVFYTERDELLAVLREMTEALGAYGSLSSEDVESGEWDLLLDAGKAARAAIAKAEGKS